MPIETVDLDALITEDATKYGVSHVELYNTIKCESDFVVDAIGDNGLAYGLSQIRIDYHPDISLEQADNPAYAIDYMAHEFSYGNEREWSCARELGY